jgi:hypothetical protein
MRRGLRSLDRKGLQHSFRGHGGAPVGVPTPGGSSHAGGTLAASATQPLASAKLMDLFRKPPPTISTLKNYF